MFDFPAAPTNGQSYSPVGGPTYTWDGQKWIGQAPVIPAAPVAATAAEYISNSAPTKMLTSGATWGAAAPVALTDGATVTPDFSLGIDFTWTLAAAGRTLANPINAKIGQKGMFAISPGASGTITTWGTMWKFTGGTKPTLTINGQDLISYWVQSASVVFCAFAPDYK
jgi:hypothetical protein